MKVHFDVFGDLSVKGEDNTEHLALGVWAERFSGGDAPLVVVRPGAELSVEGTHHPREAWVTRKIFAASGGWMTAAEFPQKAGRYEVHGAPQGKRDFYFDGAHWYLHDGSQTDLDLRSYGCPGPLWRPASAP